MSVETPSILHPGMVIVLPETENKGTIVEISDGTRLFVGDVILFTKEPVVEIEIDDVTHRIIREWDVLGWYYRPPQVEPPWEPE